jgi:leucyl/phenylalanyl-tRNA--protein transferase
VIITPDIVLQAYRMGVFPMAESRHAADIAWYDPQRRGILPIDKIHVPRRLRRTIRQQPYRITFDCDFEGVIRGCADARPETWINDEIIALYTELHRQGHAHSVEAWQGDILVGGAYGISIGAAFFGESMFSTATDASKIALVYLVARLWRQGFTLFDTQFVNSHIAQFGVVEIPRAEYHRRLAAALRQPASFSKKLDQSGTASLSSKEPGSCSIGGIGDGFAAGAGVVVESAGAVGVTGAADSAGADAASGFPGWSGAASVSTPSSSTSCLPLAAASSSGVCSGVFSDEKVSDAFADVAAFLQSITQTS